VAPIVSVLLPVAVLLKIVRVQEPDISLPIKIDLNNLAWARIEFILQEVHISISYVLRETNNIAEFNIYLLPTESFAIACRPGIATHVIAAFFPVARLIVFEEAHAFDPLG
jgi:hypothetical protein